MKNSYLFVKNLFYLFRVYIFISYLKIKKIYIFSLVKFFCYVLFKFETEK